MGLFLSNHSSSSRQTVAVILTFQRIEQWLGHEMARPPYRLGSGVAVPRI